MDKKTMEKMKQIIENNKKKNCENDLPRPTSSKGHTAKRKMRNKTGGVFDR